MRRWFRWLTWTSTSCLRTWFSWLTWISLVSCKTSSFIVSLCATFATSHYSTSFAQLSSFFAFIWFLSSNLTWSSRQFSDLWWLYNWIIWGWPHFHVIHWLNKMGICDEVGFLAITTSHIMDWFQVFVMKGSNTMMKRNSPKLPGSVTTPPINNVHGVCKSMVVNLKTSFSIPCQVTLHRLLNVFL